MQIYNNYLNTQQKYSKTLQNYFFYIFSTLIAVLPLQYNLHRMYRRTSTIILFIVQVSNVKDMLNYYLEQFLIPPP